MKNRIHEVLINYNEKPKIQSVEDYAQAKYLNIWYLIWIYDLDRILGATDKGTPGRAHGAGNPGIYLG
jgi:hypothetical protein